MVPLPLMVRRILTVLIALTFFSSITPTFAQGATLEEQTVLFTLRDDTYSAGGKVEITEASRGDVVAAGVWVTVAAPVGGDLTVAGSNIIVEGNVRDDLRAAGGEVTVSGDIGGDVLVFGGRVTIGDDASVTGDVVIYGGTITIEGRVRGNVRAEAKEINLLGIIDGNAETRSERLNFSGPIGRSAVLSAVQWYVGDRARVGGNLRYWQPQGERDFAGVLRGRSSYDATLSARQQETTRGDALQGVVAALTLFSLFSGAFIIAILLLLTKTLFRDAAKRLCMVPALSVLNGFLYFIATPFLVFLLFAILIGLPLGVMVLAAYLSSIALATPVTAIVLAKWLEHSISTPLHGLVGFLLSIGIFIILKLLIVIPFLGWLVLILTVCAAIGALMTVGWERWKKIR